MIEVVIRTLYDQNDIIIGRVSPFRRSILLYADVLYENGKQLHIDSLE